MVTLQSWDLLYDLQETTSRLEPSSQVLPMLIFRMKITVVLPFILFSDL
jgi:hypothetical protein